MNKIKKSRCQFRGRFTKEGLLRHLEICPDSSKVYRAFKFSLEDFQSVVRSLVGKAASS